MEISTGVTTFYGMGLRMEFAMYHLIAAFLILFVVSWMRQKLTFGHFCIPMACFVSHVSSECLRKTCKLNTFQLSYSCNVECLWYCSKLNVFKFGIRIELKQLFKNF